MNDFTVHLEREVDGRWVADIVRVQHKINGFVGLAYGATPGEAVDAAYRIGLEVSE